MGHSAGEEPKGGGFIGRTGIFGRSVRFLIAAAALISLGTMIDQGGVSAFRSAETAAEPSVWFLTSVTIATFLAHVSAIAESIAGDKAGRRALAIAAAGMVLVAAVAAAVGLASQARRGHTH